MIKRLLFGLFALAVTISPAVLQANSDSLLNVIQTASTSNQKLQAVEVLTKKWMQEGENLSLQSLSRRLITLANTQKEAQLKVGFLIEYAGVQAYLGEVDSFKTTLNAIPPQLNSLNDSLKVKAYSQLAEYSSRIMLYEQAVELLKQAQSIAASSRYELGLGDINFEIGKLLSNNLGQPREALTFFMQSKTEYARLKDSLNVALAMIQVGNAYIDLGEYSEAAEQYDSALEIFEPLDFKSGIARAYNNLGETFRYRGNYAQALEYYLRSIKIGEELSDTLAMSVYINNIGIIYFEQGKFEDATKFFNQALNFGQLAGFTPGLIESYNYLGLTFKKLSDYDQALENFKKSLKLSTDFGDKVGEALSYNSIGQLNLEKKFYDSAMLNFKKALDVSVSSDNAKGQVQAMLGLAKVYYSVGDYSTSISSLQRAILMAERIELKPQLIEAYKLMADNFEAQGQVAKALQYFKKFHAVSDTLNNFRVSQRLDAMENAFMAEAREKEMELLKKERELQRIELQKNQAQIDKQQAQQRGVLIGVLLLIILSVVLYIAYNERKKAFETLRSQKGEIEQKNKDITDSIEYAKIIQQAILTADSYLKQVLGDYFVFYKPKDIVSGDFYWAYQSIRNKQIVLAVVDCTGHGVPGAFMSMIGISLLNDLVIKSRIRETDIILNTMRQEVIESLHKNKSGNDQHYDGMDVSILVLDREAGTLQFSGANNSLYLVRDEMLQEFKGDKQPIGVFMGEPTPFSKHIIQVQKGDVIYLTTDGYLDQFGGVDNKKFKQRQFKDLIVSLSNQDVTKQGEVIKQTHLDWKGQYEQLDDICVLAFKV